MYIIARHLLSFAALSSTQHGGFIIHDEDKQLRPNLYKYRRGSTRSAQEPRKLLPKELFSR